MADLNKKQWTTEPITPVDSPEWRQFLAGAAKDMNRKQLKTELDAKQTTKGAKPNVPMTGKDWVKFAIHVIISIAFIVPILLVLMNSFKSTISVT